MKLFASIAALAMVVGCSPAQSHPPNYAEALAVYTAEQEELDRLENKEAKLLETHSSEQNVLIETARANVLQDATLKGRLLTDDELKELTQKTFDDQDGGAMPKRHEREAKQMAEKVEIQRQIVRKAEVAKNAAAPK